jgi:predicted metal-dependent RNase
MVERGFSTIIVDTGKNFQAAALEWFPKYSLRRIDAVLITHAHADGDSCPVIAPLQQMTDNPTPSYEWTG